MTNRQLFLQHVAQTSPAPIGLEIARAEGVYLYDTAGKPYLDLISGFSVMNMGHGNARVREAVQQQVDAYMHLMVYGEIIETPQVQYARRLTQHLPPGLNCVYFTNSGAEATEGAMKLAKRLTNRSRIVAFNNAYHGSTQGALSIMGGEYWRNAYRPLLPDVMHVDYNSPAALDAVTCYTACVVVEVVQAEAGAKTADRDWLQALRKKCTDKGVLLVCDEIQTGFGRTGTLWAFEQYGVVPDILLLGKALGGGLPMGAFIASYQNMQALTNNPVLGHITTFGGHPVCCAAGLASFEELLKMTDDSSQVTEGGSEDEVKDEVKVEVERSEVEDRRGEVKAEGSKGKCKDEIIWKDDASEMMFSTNTVDNNPVNRHPDSHRESPVNNHELTRRTDDDYAPASLDTAASPPVNPQLSTVIYKEQLFRSLLTHPAIKAIHGRGLLLAVEFESAELCQRICHACVQAGVITDWFLFAPNCLRVAPPLIITEQQIEEACTIVLRAIEDALSLGG